MDNFLSNFHTHCHYCDGIGSIEELTITAINKKIASLGFSSHCPLPFFNPWSMEKKNLQPYIAEIKRVKEKYKNEIEIYTGLEVDYIPYRFAITQTDYSISELDYTIGSIHILNMFEDGSPWEVDGSPDIFLKGLHHFCDGKMEQFIPLYFEAIREMVIHSTPTIVGHIDKIKIHESSGIKIGTTSKLYQEEINKTLELIKQKNIFIEVNTRAIYKKGLVEPYPSETILYKIKELDIPLVLNSDAHHPNELIAGYSNAIDLLQKVGITNLMVLKNNIWEKVSVQHYLTNYLND